FMMLLDRITEENNVFFMQNFISLKIDTPVACRLLKSTIGLLGKDQSTLLFFGVVELPITFKNKDLATPFLSGKFLYFVECTVIALSDVHNEFIHEWQQGTHGLDERIFKPDPVTDECKTRNFDCHKVLMGVFIF